MPTALEEDTASLAEMIAQDEAAKDTQTEETVADETTGGAAQTDTTTETEEEVASQTPVLDYYKSLHPDDRSIDKYTTDEDFLGGVKNLQKLIGQRETAVELKRALEAENVTTGELADWLVKRRAPKPAESSDPLSDPAYFDRSWMVQDAEGNWKISATSPVTEQEAMRRARLHQARLTERLENPKKFAEELLPLLMPEFEKRIGQAQATTATALQQRDEALAEERFREQHAAILYVGGAPNDAGDNFSAVAKRIIPIANELSEKAYPTLSARLERALAIASAETTPKPTTRTLPAAAKRQPAPAAPPAKKMTADDFDKAWPDAHIHEWMAAFPDGPEGKFTGKVPARAKTGK